MHAPFHADCIKVSQQGLCHKVKPEARTGNKEMQCAYLIRWVRRNVGIANVYKWMQFGFFSSLYECLQRKHGKNQIHSCWSILMYYRQVAGKTKLHETVWPCTSCAKPSGRKAKHYFHKQNAKLCTGDWKAYRNLKMTVSKRDKKPNTSPTHLDEIPRLLGSLTLRARW